MSLGAARWVCVERDASGGKGIADASTILIIGDQGMQFATLSKLRKVQCFSGRGPPNGVNRPICKDHVRLGSGQLVQFDEVVPGGWTYDDYASR